MIDGFWARSLSGEREWIRAITCEPVVVGGGDPPRKLKFYRVGGGRWFLVETPSPRETPEGECHATEVDPAVGPPDPTDRDLFARARCSRADDDRIGPEPGDDPSNPPGPAADGWFTDLVSSVARAHDRLQIYLLASRLTDQPDGEVLEAVLEAMEETRRTLASGLAQGKARSERDGTLLSLRAIVDLFGRRSGRIREDRRIPNGISLLITLNRMIAGLTGQPEQEIPPELAHQHTKDIQRARQIQELTDEALAPIRFYVRAHYGVEDIDLIGDRDRFLYDLFKVEFGLSRREAMSLNIPQVRILVDLAHRLKTARFEADRLRVLRDIAELRGLLANPPEPPYPGTEDSIEALKKAVSRLLPDGDGAFLPHPSPTADEAGHCPSWDPDRYTLTYRGIECLRGRRKAGAQDEILEEFQKAEWPRSIRSPFGHFKKTRDTVDNLNGRLTEGSPIRFVCGTGARTIAWEAVGRSDDGPSPSSP
jgi:hypothetical protein